MPTYLYKAVNEKGKKISGKVEANSITHLYDLLRTQNVYVTNAKEAPFYRQDKTRLNYKDLSLLCRQFSSMLHAGLSMSDTLDIMRKRGGNAKIRMASTELYEMLQKGESLTNALSESNFLFPPFMIYLVKAGELSGQLDDVLSQLHNHFDKEQKASNRVSGAMTYPLVLVFVTIAVVIFLMTFVLPKFFSLFGTVDNLPWNTRFLISISNSLIHYWYIYILVGVVLYLAGSRMMRTDRCRLRFDEFKINMPVFGKLNRTIYTSRFARTFASLFRTGIPVIESMEVCSEVLDNMYYARKFEDVNELLRSGQPISYALDATGCFDEMMVSMVYIGEQSGELDGILLSASEYFDEESQAASDKMITLLQPIMIVVLALIILFILISVLMPIYSMYGNVM